MGFACERPDKEQKKGPDNLWNIQDNQYILFECKNQVNEERAEILKEETGQMNNAGAWFVANYRMPATKSILIIPTKYISSSTGFNFPVEILRKGGLNRLKENFRKFFMEFSTYDLSNITELQIDRYLNTHQLTIDNLLNDYAESARQKSS
jgi:hypothetical protein